MLLIKYYRALLAAVIVFGTIVAAILMLATEIKHSQAQRIQSFIDINSSQFEDQFSLHWRHHLDALLRNFSRLQGDQITQQAWTQDANAYIEHFSAIEALAWMQGEEVKWLANDESYRYLFAQQGIFPRPRQSANQQIFISQAASLGARGVEFLVFLTRQVDEANTQQDYLVALIDLAKLIQPISQRFIKEGVIIEIWQAEQLLFSTGHTQVVSAAGSHQYPLTDTGWQFKVSITKHVEQALGSDIQSWILNIGLLMALACASVVYLLFKFRSQNHKILKERQMKERAQVQLEIAKNRLHLAAEASELGIWEWDLASNRLHWDMRMHQIYETPERLHNELVYEFWHQSVHPDDIELAQRSLQASVEDKQPWAFEFRILLKDGRVKYIKANAEMMKDDQGNVIKVVGGNLDITQERESQQAMQMLMLQAEQANKAKSVFLANMSHEIRTPMNGVIGLSKLLSKTELNTRQQEYLNLIINSAKSLLAVLDDVLDLSKIESGQLSIEQISFNLDEKVGDVLKSFAPAIHDKQVEFHYRIAPEVPIVIQSDPVRIGQILFNLVGNAQKFTQNGEICVEITTNTATPIAIGDLVELQISVRDSGVGIPEERLKEIFKPFHQADSSTTRNFGGSGLGLTIVKQLTDLLGGSVTINSAPGQGTQVEVKLPVRAAAADHVKRVSLPISKQMAETTLQNLNCLVVDDNSTNRIWLQDMINSWGAKVELAADAEQAINALEQSRYDIMFLDKSMPKVDGFAMLQQLERVQLDRPPVVVMLSATPSELDSQRIEILGVDQYLLKPIKQSEVFNAIVNIIHRNQADTETKIQEESNFLDQSTKTLDILVAEDNLVNQRLVQDILEYRGHRVWVVENGVQALEQVQQHKFDVVLMDVQMPKMDGYEATKAIREWEASSQRHTWIIGLTAHALSGDKELCLGAGMDLYLTKPIDSEKLISIIENEPQYEKNGQLIAISSGKSESSDQVALAAQNVVKTQPPVIFDIDKSLVITGHRQELLVNMVNLTLEQMPKSLAHIQNFIDAGHHEEVAVELHKLKGMVRNFSNASIDHAFNSCEKLLANNDFVAFADNWEVLEKQLSQFTKELKAFIKSQS